jgi:hypothetical protein
MTRWDRSGADDIKAMANAARLFSDEKWMELGKNADAEIRQLVHDALIRFKEAGYDMQDAVVALAFSLTKVLALIERDIKITPGDLGRLVAEALIMVREEDRKRKQ